MRSAVRCVVQISPPIGNRALQAMAHAPFVRTYVLKSFFSMLRHGAQLLPTHRQIAVDA